MDAEFSKIVEDLGKRMEKIGLYMRDVMLATSEMDEEMSSKMGDSAAVKAMIESGEAKFAIMAVFTIGDLAFSDRIQHPELYKEETEFRKIMPSEAELKAEFIRNRIKQGKPLFAADDEDTDETTDGEQ